jgi:four helix bundle protein
MKESPLLEKSYKFALRIVKLCRYLMEERNEFVLSREILRTGTAIGSYIEGATQADSTSDFIHNLSSANQNAFKTNYWLRLLRDSEYITDKQAQSLLGDCDELQKLLITSIKTSRRKLETNTQ